MEAIQEQLYKLKQAKHACVDCGRRHGDYWARDPQFFEAVCPVCGKLKLLTDAKHFGYFYRGLCNLRRRKARLERNEKQRRQAA